MPAKVAQTLGKCTVDVSGSWSKCESALREAKAEAGDSDPFSTEELPQAASQPAETQAEPATQAEESEPQTAGQPVSPKTELNILEELSKQLEGNDSESEKGPQDPQEPTQGPAEAVVSMPSDLPAFTEQTGHSHSHSSPRLEPASCKQPSLSLAPSLPSGVEDQGPVPSQKDDQSEAAIEEAAPPAPSKQDKEEKKEKKEKKSKEEKERKNKEAKGEKKNKKDKKERKQEKGCKEKATEQVEEKQNKKKKDKKAQDGTEATGEEATQNEPKDRNSELMHSINHNS